MPDERAEHDAGHVAPISLMRCRQRARLDRGKINVRIEEPDRAVNVVEIDDELPERRLRRFDLAGDLRALPNEPA